MSEFMLILPGDRAGAAPAGPTASDQAALLRQMEACLAGLDRHDAGIAAAHLALAIDHARIAFNLAEDSSGTD